MWFNQYFLDKWYGEVPRRNHRHPKNIVLAVGNMWPHNTVFDDVIDFNFIKRVNASTKAEIMSWCAYFLHKVPGGCVFNYLPIFRYGEDIMLYKNDFMALCDLCGSLNVILCHIKLKSIENPLIISLLFCVTDPLVIWWLTTGHAWMILKT